MKWIIHDWDDDQATTLLKNCRLAMGDEGRLLIVERVIPPGNDESLAKMGDILMLLLPGGRERTEAEYRELLDAADFELTRIVFTASEMDIIEGVPR